MFSARFRAVTVTFIASALPLAAHAQSQRSTQLNDGPGKQSVEAVCSACHPLSQITRSVGYTRDRWRYVFDHMIELPDPLADEISDYLAENYPPTGERAPVIVPGAEVVEFREWVAPTLGQRVRDPFMHSDGSIWWTGMWGSLLGRLDPATGAMQEFALDPEARPHSSIEGPDGSVWYSGNGNGTIGRLDPESGRIRVFPLDDPDARDPHTMEWANDGSLWFTLQNSNMIGRLEPSTGEVWLDDMPTERARPYGIRRDSEGNLWIAYRGAYKLGRLNPETREITEFETPNYGRFPGLPHYVRRLAIDSHDNVWYVDSGRGELGRFDPRTETFEQWPTPSGASSHPYAIHVVDDIVWLNESDMRPDALLRFDPETETFQSWEIPSGIGIIRNMTSTPGGNLIIHQSSTNTVGAVLIGEDNIAHYHAEGVIR